MPVTAKDKLTARCDSIMEAAKNDGRPITRAKAVQMAFDDDSELHQQYVAEFNEEHLDKSLGRCK